MRVSLYLTEMNGEHVPLLWNDKLGDYHKKDSSILIDSMDAFDVARLQCSNRSREIFIVKGRDAALTQARILDSDTKSMMTLTHLGEDAWALGRVSLDGDYDDGFPRMLETRIYGSPIMVQGDKDLVARVRSETLFPGLENDSMSNLQEVSPAAPQPKYETPGYF